MYQSPDLVKVNLEIKDNFAAYTTTCIENTYTSMAVGACDVPTDPSYNFIRFTQQFPSSPHECYNDVI